MSEQNANVPVSIDKKREQWGNLGVGIHKKELQLQAMKEAAIKDIVIPKEFKDVLAAEEKLKSLRKSKKELSDYRIKEITSYFDPLFSRLSGYEKELDPKMSELETAIIKVKQAEAIRVAAIKAKEDEERRLKEFAISLLATKKADFKTNITTRVLYAFEWALTNKVTMKTLEEYIGKCSKKVTVMDFTATIDIPAWRNKVTEAEARVILDQNFTLDANEFVELFREKLKEKFAVYEVDLLNAEQALEKSQDEHAAAVTEIATEKTNEQMSANLEMLATDISSIGISGVRDLKKKFIVEQPVEDVELAKCFIANAKELLPLIKTKAFYNAILAAIEAHKNKNNSFEPSNIKFKQIDKL